MTWSAGAILTAAQLNTYLPQARSTWVPTVTAESGTFTTVDATGRYIHMGALVFFDATVTITTVGTAAAGVKITLPVTAAFTTSSVGNGRSAITGAALQVRLNTTTSATIIKYDDTTPIGVGDLRVNGFYWAA